MCLFSGNRVKSSVKITLMLAIGLVVGFSDCTIAQSQQNQASIEADALTGTVEQCYLSEQLVGTCTKVTIAPIDQSVTTSPGSNDALLMNSSQTIFGVEVYNFSDIDDTTSISGTANEETDTANANTGVSRLLGGLISWDSNNEPITCTPDSVGLMICNGVQITKHLAISGREITSRIYSTGSSFPVHGTVSDSTCVLGTETFDGTLVLQEELYTEPPNNTLNLVGMHLYGTAQCKSLDLVTLFKVNYDLQVAGPRLAKNTTGPRFGGSSSSHYCGAAIVNTTWIVTAAHCVDDFKEADIVAGASQ